MIATPYVFFALLYTCQMSTFTHSKVTGTPVRQSLNVDSLECSPNDLFCFENKSADDAPMAEHSGSHSDIAENYEDGNDSFEGTSDVNDLDDETRNEDVSPVNEYGFKELSTVKSLTVRVKRSPLELVEERPPEATYSTPSDQGENRTPRSLPPVPSMPSVPSMPQMPSMPSLPPVPSMPQPPTASSLDPTKQLDTPTTNDVTTIPPDVEVIETTTEDFGNIGDPVCEYDVITYILKCGINLLTSIFGLSDTCCKPIF